MWIGTSNMRKEIQPSFRSFYCHSQTKCRRSSFKVQTIAVAEREKPKRVTSCLFDDELTCFKCQRNELQKIPRNDFTECESMHCINFWAHMIVNDVEEIRLMSAATTNAFGAAGKRGRKNRYRIKLREHHGLHTKDGFIVAVPIKEVCDIMRLSAVPQ